MKVLVVICNDNVITVVFCYVRVSDVQAKVSGVIGEILGYLL